MTADRTGRDGPATGNAGTAGAGPAPAGRAAGPARVDYRSYLASAAWRASAARLAELGSAGHRCRLCGAGGPGTRLEVHHNTYARLGRERARDLCTLCAPCHAVVTGELRRRRHDAIRLPAPADATRTLAGRRLVDNSVGHGEAVP